MQSEMMDMEEEPVLFLLAFPPY